MAPRYNSPVLVQRGNPLLQGDYISYRSARQLSDPFLIHLLGTGGYTRGISSYPVLRPPELKSIVPWRVAPRDSVTSQSCGGRGGVLSRCFRAAPHHNVRAETLASRRVA